MKKIVIGTVLATALSVTLVFAVQVYNQSQKFEQTKKTTTKTVLQKKQRAALIENGDKSFGKIGGIVHKSILADKENVNKVDESIDALATQVASIQQEISDLKGVRVNLKDRIGKLHKILAVVEKRTKVKKPTTIGKNTKKTKELPKAKTFKKQSKLKNLVDEFNAKPNTFATSVVKEGKNHRISFAATDMLIIDDKPVRVSAVKSDELIKLFKTLKPDHKIESAFITVSKDTSFQKINTLTRYFQKQFGQKLKIVIKNDKLKNGAKINLVVESEKKSPAYFSSASR